MIMNLSWIIIPLILFGITGFSESFADKQITIKLGQTIHADDLELSFYNIDDSRCLSDVTCVWEGQVTAMIHIQNQTHQHSEQFTPGYTSDYITPHKITLVDVSPYPISTEKPDYLATLMMSNLADRTVCEEHMILKNEFCVTADPTASDFRETGEERYPIMIIVESLGAILIVFFIIIYAVNKRRLKNKL